MIDVWTIATLSLFPDDLAGLAFCADKENLSAIGRDASKEVQRVTEHGQRPFKINNMNLVSGAEDIGTHFWRPEPCLMAKVNASL